MINWGIVGLGNIAARFAASLKHSTGGRLYAVASSKAAKREQYCSEYPGLKAYAAYEQLCADGNVDAIYIALPHGMHMQYSIQAMRAGKAVLCEKPVTLSGADTRAVIECARESGVFFMEAMKTRFLPMMDRIKAELHGGLLGEIYNIYANFCSQLDLGAYCGSFITDPAQGGALLDVGPYPVSFVTDLLGYDISRVQSDIRTNEDGLILHATGGLHYSNGTAAKVEVGIDGRKERTAVIKGEKGTMRVPVYNRPTEYIVDFANGRQVHEQQPLEVDDMFGEIEEVHRCLEAGLAESPRCPWADTIAVMDIIDDLKKG